jgi:hypothetical protein
VLAEYDNLAG